MKIARAETQDGVVRGEYEGDDDYNGTVSVNGETYDVSPSNILAPCEPDALYCVGRNYVAKIDQMEYDVPDVPDFFIKPPTSVLAPGKPIPYPDFTDELTYAGELGIVIGEECKHVSEDGASDVIEGYTVMNDVDALDQERRTARKAFDGSAPLGPWVETEVDPTSIEIETTINGETRQEANTEQMLFDVYEITAFMSRRFTLQRGDVIACGSPANPGTIEPGDEIEITYEGIGTLRNTVGS
ncbi:MAG: fumarylacetoacetate hydrolase family protein [Halobacteria archaeon]|nr:fumarylacetoacetate hydrolase family protein [Halobacteria archaeon]